MEKIYDLFLFMGQSNMAGRGITSPQWPEPAPKAASGAGYEYRAISDPEQLHEIEEPFGAAENHPGGIFEPGMKTGSMVTSFVNAYYAASGRSVIGVSASKGGSSIGQWQGNEDYLTDALMRLKRAQEYLKRRQMVPAHPFVLWCQGETDGDLGTSGEEYKTCFTHMLDILGENGIKTCFLITIGEYNGEKGYDYSRIRQAQLELAQQDPRVKLVCDAFHTMKERGLMKDEFHYYQKAYNEVGQAAGKAAGEFVNGAPI